MLFACTLLPENGCRSRKWDGDPKALTFPLPPHTELPLPKEERKWFSTSVCAELTTEIWGEKKTEMDILDFKKPGAFSGENGGVFNHIIKCLAFPSIADLRMAACHHHSAPICLSSIPVWSWDFAGTKRIEQMYCLTQFTLKEPKSFTVL